jgi:2-isopropylmalate synthase
MRPSESDLIYDWNVAGNAKAVPARTIEFDDETLRDGLQSPSVTSPPIEKKLEILHLIDRLGIQTADIGLPGAGPHVVAHVTRLAQEIKDARLKVTANCAARTLESDIRPVAEISQKVGLPIHVIGFGPREERIECFRYDFLARVFVTDTDRAEGRFNRDFRSLPTPIAATRGPNDLPPPFLTLRPSIVLASPHLGAQ